MDPSRMRWVTRRTCRVMGWLGGRTLSLYSCSIAWCAAAASYERGIQSGLLHLPGIVTSSVSAHLGLKLGADVHEPPTARLGDLLKASSKLESSCTCANGSFEGGHTYVLRHIVDHCERADPRDYPGPPIPVPPVPGVALALPLALRARRPEADVARTVAKRAWSVVSDLSRDRIGRLWKCS